MAVWILKSWELLQKAQNFLALAVECEETDTIRLHHEPNHTPFLNKSLVGLSHRLLAQAFLSGHQTSLTFSQPGTECQHPTTVLRLKDPSSEQPNTLLSTQQHCPGPRPE